MQEQLPRAISCPYILYISRSCASLYMHRSCASLYMHRSCASLYMHRSCASLYMRRSCASLHPRHTVHPVHKPFPDIHVLHGIRPSLAKKTPAREALAGV